MTDGDDEDLFIMCIGTVCEQHERADQPYSVNRVIEEAKALYAATKEMTAKSMAEKPKLVPQLRS